MCGHVVQNLRRVGQSAASGAPSPANSVTKELHTGVTPLHIHLVDAIGRSAPVAEVAAFDAAISAAASTHSSPPPSPPVTHVHCDADVASPGSASVILSPPAVAHGADRLPPHVRRSVAELAIALPPDVLRRRLSEVDCNPSSSGVGEGVNTAASPSTRPVPAPSVTDADITVDPSVKESSVAASLRRALALTVLVLNLEHDYDVDDALLTSR